MLENVTKSESLRPLAERSAEAVVPLVTNLIGPCSVLDVGCGDGTWLLAYGRAGVADCVGVDKPHVRASLKISAERFVAADLAALPDLGRRFDLIQSLSVAEHLPAACAEGFVRSLIRHGDAVLFSAAIPYQGGVEHANGQWPDYWAELFQREGFAIHDWLRPRVWDDDRVAWCYSQNALLFVREGTTAEWAKRLPRPTPVGPLLRLVHPRGYLAAVTRPEGRGAVEPPPRPARPYDVAVVIPTVGRDTLARAVRSVYAQDLPGTVQILVGIDAWTAPRPRDAIRALAREAPPNRTLTVFDPGYSTSVRHGGVHPARDGGALRTILSYAAHSRRVAYLDDDNWWAPDHLSSLVRAVVGHDWAYSLRWYVDPATGVPLCVDAWESVGPDTGAYAARFGGFVDPSCLLIDVAACEPVLRLWCRPLPKDLRGMSSDRSVFAYLRGRKRGAGTARATSYYTLSPDDVNHPNRLRWIASVRGRPSAPGSPPIPPTGGGTD